MELVASASGGRIDVGILGATGVVGQHFVALLADHPWFRVTWLAASERSAGQRYGDLAVAAADAPAGRDARRCTIAPLDAVDEAPSLLFSGARLVGRRRGGDRLRRAADGIVVSNARNHRMDPLVPLLIPEVNPDHLGAARSPARARAAGPAASSPTRTAPPSSSRWSSARCGSSSRRA